MKLQPVAQADLAKRAASGDFDAFIFEMAGRSLARVYEFWRSHDGMMVKTEKKVKLDGVMAGDKVKITTNKMKMGTMVEKM